MRFIYESNQTNDQVLKNFIKVYSNGKILIFRRSFDTETLRIYRKILLQSNQIFTKVSIII